MEPWLKSWIENARFQNTLPVAPGAEDVAGFAAKRTAPLS
jgi:hypothetical protein